MRFCALLEKNRRWEALKWLLPHWLLFKHWCSLFISLWIYTRYCTLSVFCLTHYAHGFLCNIRKQANSEVCILKCIAAWQPRRHFFYSSPHQDIVCNVTIHCMLMEEKVMELLHLQHATKKVCTGDIWTQFFSLIKASVWVKEWLQICACLKVNTGHRKNKIAQQNVLVGFQPKI